MNSFNDRIVSTKYKNDAERALLAKNIAAEGIVLLKNEGNILPLDTEKTLAVFGRGQIKTQAGGMGSGASSGAEVSTIIDGLINLGFKVDSELSDKYRQIVSNEPLGDMSNFMELVTSGKIYEIWGKYSAPEAEPILEDDLVEAAAVSTDTAIIVITRNSGGEECDRRVEGDYYLLDEEKTLINQVSDNFKHVIIILNVNGFVDINWINDYKNIDTVLFAGLPGQEGGIAIAEILAGKVTPSGKLSATMALKYEDYPSAAHFSFNKDAADSILTYESYGLDAEDNGSTGFNISPVTVYQESIYMGYRYFDTFGKEVMFPFGYGLSYTNFEIKNTSNWVDKSSQTVNLTVEVYNKGKVYSGKEIVQVYISAPDGVLEKPYQQLTAYAKTNELKPGERQTIDINFPLSELSAYDEKSASYIIEKGMYIIRVGNSSRNTNVAAKLVVEETIIIEQLRNKLQLNSVNASKLKFLSKKDANPITYIGEAEEIAAAPVIGNITSEYFNLKAPYEMEKNFVELNTSATNYQLKDVKSGDITLEQFVSQLSKEELSVLVNGYGIGIGFVLGDYPKSIQYDNGIDIGINTSLKGNDNYVSPGIKRLGIPSISYLDGPAGVRITAWPTETLMACTWNDKLLYEFGDAVGEETYIKGRDSWLAPAVNLHRNPIGGRNFEYYSEDPLLTGECAVSVANGVQENHNITVCAKHFAINEQETYRRGNLKKNVDAADSIIQERTAREIYLKPFEMLVKRTSMRNIMTSFNKINGIFAAGNRELCTDILRNEWNFKGFVVTDWGDMDIVVDGADAMAAGNDVVMPGGPPVIKQVLEGLKSGKCTVAQLQRNVLNLLAFVVNSEAYDVYQNTVGEITIDQIACTTDNKNS